MKFVTRVIALILLCSCNNETNDDSSEVEAPKTPVINYAVVKSHIHDTTAYTEGLLVNEGQLFESTGASPGVPNTRSLFGVLDLRTGIIDKKAELDGKKYFGEGIAFLHDKVYQLTYRTKIGFIYDAKTYRQLREFDIPAAEGWGMTTDGQLLVMSDGTDQLRYLDPVSLKVVRTVSVSDHRGPVIMLNELEFINGFIYANVYTTHEIVKINPADGKVVARLDLTSLANEAKALYPGSMEMNGIAYDPEAGTIFITGKMWPRLYEIVFSH